MSTKVSRNSWIVVEDSEFHSDEVARLAETEDLPTTVLTSNFEPVPLESITETGTELVLEIAVELGVRLFGAESLEILVAVEGEPGHNAPEGQKNLLIRKKQLGDIEQGELVLIADTGNISQKKMFISRVMYSEPKGLDTVWEVKTASNQPFIVNGFIVQGE